MKYNELMADEQVDKSAYHTRLLQKAAVEFKAAYDYVDNKRTQWETRLRLYSNQMKGIDTVGDPLLYSTIQTVVASLYDDKLSAHNIPSRDEDSDKAEMVNNLCSNDYYLMNRNQMDYYWDWNACFYGFAPLLLQKWDKKKNCPIPELMDPMTFLFDPEAVLVNPEFGKPGLRFFGRQLYKDLSSLRSHQKKKKEKPEKGETQAHEDMENMSGSYFNVDWEPVEANGMGQKVSEVKQARANVQNLNYTRTQSSTGAQMQCLVTEWWTLHTDDDGVTKKMYFEIKGNIADGIDKCCIIRCEELPKQFQEEWPLINRVLSPVPEQFIGISIPDLVEDKQRYRSKILNLTLLSQQYAAHGMYMIDRSRVDMEAIGTPRPNKLIGVDGPTTGAIEMVPREGARQDSQWVMSYLDQLTQQATATPAIQQGMTPDTSRSATELATQRMNIDKRYSLSAKIFGWSEREFWQQWYRCYDCYFIDAKPKIIRVEGPIDTLFDELRREDFIMDDAPEFRVESAVMSEIERQQKLQNLTNFLMTAGPNPRVNQDGVLDEMARLTGLDMSQRYAIVPKTPDQLIAEGNNDMILEGKMPRIDIKDNHMVCIMTAAKLPESKIRDLYIKRHKEAMLMIRENPEIMPAPGAVNPANPMEPNPALAPVGDGASQPKVDYKTPNFQF